MRGTSSRSVFMAVGLACVVGISVGFACAGEARVAEQKAMYGGHRALVWAFDPQKPGDVRGFAEATLKPGAAQTLEPAKGHSIEFTLGPVGESEYHDGVKSWVEASVDLQAAHGSGRSNSTLDLTSPRVSVEYPHPPKWPLQSVAVLVPLGTLSGAATGDAAGGKFAGEAGELEDLLIAGASDGLLEADTVAEAMGIVGKTSRQTQWTELMNGGDPVVATTASAALARVGDAQGQARFAKACLASRGDEQVRLMNVLASMPPSDVLIGSMVDLIVTDRREYRLRGPAADMDRRYSLLDAIRDYPPELLAPHAARLREWAKGPGQQFAGQVEAILKADGQDSHER